MQLSATAHLVTQLLPTKYLWIQIDTGSLYLTKTEKWSSTVKRMMRVNMPMLLPTMIQVLMQI